MSMEASEAKTLNQFMADYHRLGIKHAPIVKLKPKPQPNPVAIHIPKILPPAASPLEAKRIMLACADYFSISIADIRGPSRKQIPVMARQAFYAIALKRTGMSRVRMGQMTHRDHSSVIHALRSISGKPQVVFAIEYLLDKLA